MFEISCNRKADAGNCRQCADRPSRTKKRPPSSRFFLAPAFGLMLLVTCISLTLRADELVDGPIIDVPVYTIAIGESAASEENDPDEKKFSQGAVLKTDPELESLLKRAELFAGEKRYDLAVILWQKVLDETGDTLLTHDGKIYTSLTDEIERTLAKLPPEGLRVYRLSADGEARALLSQAKQDASKQHQVLSEIVQRYFISAHGDEAAYKLACLAMDRYDFVGASRLLMKILQRHPDSTVSKSDILLRLAVASARVGDAVAAKTALAELNKTDGARPTRSVMAAIQADVERSGKSSALLTKSSRDWLMPLGGAGRKGYMQSLPDAAMSSTLTELWGTRFPVKVTKATATPRPVFYSSDLPGTPIVSDPTAPAGKTSADDKSIAHNWQSKGWSPAGQILFSDGKVFSKTGNELLCWDAKAVETDGDNDNKIAWRSAWKNNYQPDSMTMFYLNMGIQKIVKDRPVTPHEVMLFGDRVHQSMSISHGHIYSIEGRRIESGKQAAKNPSPRPFQYGVTPRRSRSNWLAAYEVQSGKAMWHRSPSDIDKSGDSELGFLAAPVPFGNLLLVPVTDGGTLWLYALSYLDGKTIWKTYLCDEPQGGCSPWSPVAVSVEGSDAYVVCGAGVVFAIDAVSGSIRFAMRYERHGKPNRVMGTYGYGGGGTLLDLNGWEEDVVIPYGRALIVMPSDHDWVFAIDRRTGKLLWQSPRTPLDHSATYCLGIVGRDLYVAGKNVVRRIRIVTEEGAWSGSVVKELELKKSSFGRGVLTEDGIYLPIANSIARLDLKTLKIKKQVGVQITSDEPVGNLFSDGNKLWVVGGNHLYTLTNLEHRLVMLKDRIEKGDVQAILDRMLLYAKLGKSEEATADLQNAYKLLAQRASLPEATAMLLRGISEIQLTENNPALALNVIGDIFLNPDGTPAKLKLDAKLTSRRQETIHAALYSIRNKKTPGAVNEILQVAGLLEKEYLLTIAGQAISETAGKEDVDRLREALMDRHSQVKIIATEGLAKVAGQDAKEPLQKLLQTDQENVRLAAARGLANLGERKMLTIFAKLMESDDPMIRARSYQALRVFTNQQLPFVASDEVSARAKAVKAWQQWIEKEGGKAELTYPLPVTDALLGRTLICDYEKGVILELGHDGKQRWKKIWEGALACQGLANGHRLVASISQRKIVEFDESGQEVWRYDDLPGKPFSVRRLENGNTLVACFDSGKVLEIRRDGSIARQISVEGGPTDARRLENGRTLIALADIHQVVEVDQAGAVVWKVENMNSPYSAQRLPNGNTLVAQRYGGEVVEVNQKGEVVWSKSGLAEVFDVQRLANGNTLFGDAKGVQEVDVKGKTVWQRSNIRASGVSRY